MSLSLRLIVLSCVVILTALVYIQYSSYINIEDIFEMPRRKETTTTTTSSSKKGATKKQQTATKAKEVVTTTHPAFTIATTTTTTTTATTITTTEQQPKIIQLQGHDVPVTWEQQYVFLSIPSK